MRDATSAIEIHLLTNCETLTDKYLHFIDDCAAAGINYLQLRQKHWPLRDLIAFGRELKTILSKYQVPLIINDNLALAVELDAEGLHLGQTDISVVAARNSLGQGKIIGLSIESIDQLTLANQTPELNYVAASAVFPSLTKHNLKKIWGLAGLKQFSELSHHQVVAIGGIGHENLEQVLACNVQGVALISAIHESLNPRDYISQLLTISARAKNEII